MAIPEWSVSECCTLCDTMFGMRPVWTEVMGNLEEAGFAHSSECMLCATAITHAECVIQVHIHASGINHHSVGGEVWLLLEHVSVL